MGYEQIQYNEQQKQIETILASAKEVFDLCKDIVDPDEVKEMAQTINKPRAGGYLLVGVRNSESDVFGNLPYFDSKGCLFLGVLSDNQVKPARENRFNFVSKFISYWNAAFTKCAHIGGFKPDFPNFEYLNKIPLGAIEIPNTDVIVGFSGFLPKKDDLFVLTLLVKTHQISRTEAKYIALQHGNMLFFNNMKELVGE